MTPNRRETTENVAGVGLKYAIVKDTRPSDTNAEENTINTWQSRVLNTLQTNIPGCSLSNNQLTLPPGEYKIYAFVPCFNVSKHQARLRNITDNISVFSGSTGFGHGTYGGMADSIIQGILSISDLKAFEIQSYTKYSYPNGLGIAMYSGEEEVYTQIEIIKLG